VVVEPNRHEIFKRVARAIVYGVIAPFAIAPFAALIVVPAYHFFPHLFGDLGDVIYRVFSTLIPERDYKGLLIPVIIMMSPLMFVGDLVAMRVAWRVERSSELAAITLVTTLLAQLALVSAVCLVLGLTW